MRPGKKTESGEEKGIKTQKCRGKEIVVVR
jgi:hypothetical protein